MNTTDRQINLNKEMSPETAEAISALGAYVIHSAQDAPTLALPSMTLRDAYRDEANRVIWLCENIEPATLCITRSILQYNREDKDLPVEERKPIKIFIDTDGGDVPTMLSIVSAIKASKTPVYTINWCNAISAGAHILAAGHKRYALAGSTVLIHNGSCGYSGTVEQVASAKKYGDSQEKRANDQLLADTAIPASLLKKKASGDWWLTTEEALEYKVIDQIIADLDEVL